MAATLSASFSACFAPLHDHGTTDAALLARYAEFGDAAAFGLLVKRHGGMVAAVCRKRLRHAHDAEDAAQAVFLALARKASRVAGQVAVAAWLYGAAVKACNGVARRNRRKPWVTLTAEPAGDTVMSPDFEAVAAVLDEVARLPEACRAAVVLCELEGVPRTLAARRLGVAEGTLSSRLATARKRLADRLERRGFGPAALAVLTGLASGVAAPAVSLPSLTLAAPAVVRLTEVIMTTTLAWKAKLAATLTVATMTLTFAVTAGDGPPAKPPETPRPTTATPGAVSPRFVIVEAADGNQAITTTEVTAAGRVAARRTESVKPTTDAILAVAKKPASGDSDIVTPLAYDADGQATAFTHVRHSESSLKKFLMPGSEPKNWREPSYRTFLRTPSGKLIPTDQRDDAAIGGTFWSHDGKSLFRVVTTTAASVSLTPPFASVNTTHRVQQIDATMGDTREIFFAPGDRPLAIAPDGRTFLVVSTRGDSLLSSKVEHRLGLAECKNSKDADAVPIEPLTVWGPTWFQDGAFSPDGTKFAVSAGECHYHPLELLPPEEQARYSKHKPVGWSRFVMVGDTTTGLMDTPEKAALPAVTSDGLQGVTAMKALAVGGSKCVPGFGKGLQWNPDGTAVAFTDADHWTRDDAGLMTAHAACVVELGVDGTSRRIPLPRPTPEPHKYEVLGPTLVGWR